MIIRKTTEVRRTCLIAKRGTLTIIDVNHILQKSNLVKTNYSSARSILYQSEAWKKILKVRNEDNYFHGTQKQKMYKGRKATKEKQQKLIRLITTYFQYIIEKNVLCPSCTRILYW